MGKSSSSPPQVDAGALAQQQAEINRINQITPFGSVFFGEFTQPPGTGTAPAPATPGLDPAAFRQQLGRQLSTAANPQPQFTDQQLQALAQQRGVTLAAPGGTAPGSIPATNVPGQPENFSTTSQTNQVLQLSPEIQAALDAQLGASGTLANQSQALAGRLPDTPFSFPTTDFSQDVRNAPFQDFGGALNDFEAQNRERVEQSIFERGRGLLDPVFQREEERLRDRLANAGQLGFGATNPGAQQELDIFGTNRNEAFERLALDAIRAGSGETAREFGQAATSAQLGQGEAARRFAQTQAGAILGGQEEARALASALTQRALPFQELASLLGQSQIVTPQIPIPGGGAAPVDVIGPAQLALQSQNAAFANNQADDRALMGGLLGLGGAALGASQSSILGGLLSGAGLFCWIAREVYGADNPKWLRMREWMLTKAPDSLREFYLEHGPRLAEFIADKPERKAVVRAAMDRTLSHATA